MRCIFCGYRKLGIINRNPNEYICKKCFRTFIITKDGKHALYD